MKKHDPTRPASAGQSATLELDTMHNPITLDRMKERENVKVPILWDESFCIFQGDLWGDTREMWLDPGERDYYIYPLIPVWDAVQASKNVQGSMIWAWVDDIFLVPGRDSEYGRGRIGKPVHALDRIYHIPGRGIVGDAPWGIVDGWRRKKPEFWHVKMLMSPVHMQHRDLPAWKSGDAATFTVDNRYEFTNLSELSLEWSIGSQHGTFIPTSLRALPGKSRFLSEPRPNRAMCCRCASWTIRNRLVFLPHAIGNCLAPMRTNAQARAPPLSARTFLAGRPHGTLHGRQLRNRFRWRKWPHASGTCRSPLGFVWDAEASCLADRSHAERTSYLRNLATHQTTRHSSRRQ